MNFRIILQRVAFIALAAALWLTWWCQPERQVRRAQARLCSAIESRDFEAFARFLADEYRDRWGHDKEIVLTRTREVFSQFLLLEILRTSTLAEPADGTWTVREKITLRGFGGHLAIAARDRVNTLPEPFAFTWHQPSWKPWEWRLTRVDHPRLEPHTRW